MAHPLDLTYISADIFQMQTSSAVTGMMYVKQRICVMCANVVDYFHNVLGGESKMERSALNYSTDYTVERTKL